MRRVWLFLVIASVHFVAQMSVWALHPGNRPPGADAEWARAAWNVLSLPWFLIPEPTATIWFWPITLLNSATWAAVVIALAARLTRRRGS